MDVTARDRVGKLTSAQLLGIINNSDDEELVDAALDELEYRERDMELFDWTEQDARARAEERFQLFMDEY
jgi:hypothetical protein